MNKTIRNGFVLKGGSNPFGDQYELTGYATVEVPDFDNDIVRVKGIDLSLHRPESPMKVMLHHKRDPFSDGTVPVVATISEFKQTTAEVNGKEYPALAFGAMYAREGDQMTAFATKCKGLVDGGTLDQFSFGLRGCAGPERKPRGQDIQSCQPFELSLCTLARNPYATVFKALSDALGEDFNPGEHTEQRLIEVLKSVDSHGEVLKGLMGRLDRIESGIVALSEGPAKPKADRELRAQENETVTQTLKEIAATLRGLSAT
jgi:hypothetical protein